MSETFDYDQKVHGKGEAFDYDEVFNYEVVTMGVSPGGREKNYFVSFADDYRLKRLTESLKLKGGKLADLGCGGGLLTESLVHYYPKTKLFGCDVSKTAIAFARKLGSGKVTYSVIKNKKLPYKSNSLNACTCLDVLEHISDVDFFLKEVKRILKRGGQFFLVVPCEGQVFTYTWLLQKIRFGEKLTYKHWGHIHPEFTHKSVKTLLRKHGFLIKHTTYGEHLLQQIVNLFAYFLPKEAMEIFLGKSASKYYDRGVFKKEVTNNRRTDILDLVRKAWLFCGGVLVGLAKSPEIDLLKNVSLTAWKINLHAVVNKKQNT